MPKTSKKRLGLAALELLAMGVATAAFAAGPARPAKPLASIPPGAMLHTWLLDEVARQAGARARNVNVLLHDKKPRELIEARRDSLRDQFQKLVGELPVRTPLNAHVVGTIDCGDYTIERVLFESRPRHHVTANLYLPKNQTGKIPGVLVPCGHTDLGKAGDTYQSACILLALNGCAALIYDPIGQGERNQLPEPTKHGTCEHTLVGVGALLVGWNTGHYRIWDGMRAMDYLASRPEVDPQKLGCTGNSGGGTLTTWLMALDDRIAVAAPSCFITSLTTLFRTIGPQDCEQHFPNQGPLGIDHVDFITMRAPKPTLILAAEQDYFDIRGTREAFSHAQAIYARLGRLDQLAFFSYPDGHGFSRPRREAAVAWMRRWLANDDRPVNEPELKLQSAAALQVTEAGQVASSFADERTVIDLAVERTEVLSERRTAKWQAKNDRERLQTIRQVFALPTRDDDRLTPERVLIEKREGYTIERLLLKRVNKLPTYAAWCVHQGQDNAPRRPAVLVCDSRGMAPHLEPGGTAERWIAQGHAVLVVDLLGYGTTADAGDDANKYQNREFRTAMLAMHVGKPLVGQRVDELLAVWYYLAERPDIDPARIRIEGFGQAGVAALHVSALEPRVAGLTLHDTIKSWADDVVAKPLVPDQLGLAVPGVLEHYDLPDVAAMVGERLSVAGSAASPENKSRLPAAGSKP